MFSASYPRATIHAVHWASLHKPLPCTCCCPYAYIALLPVCKSIGDFKGVTFLELDELEDVIKIDIDVFEVRYEPSCLVPIRRRAYRHYNVFHLLLVHSCHVCYIKDIDAATKTFGCLRYCKQYNQRFRLARHQKTCAGG